MNLFINSYCHIHSSKIYKEGKLLHDIGSGSIEKTLKTAYQLLALNYPKYYKMDSLCKVGILAAEVLLAGESVVNLFSKEECAIILCNSDSSLDTDLKHQETLANQDAFYPSPALFVYTLPNIVAGVIAIKYQLKGENLFYISPSFDFGQTQRLVENIFFKPQTSASLVGWINVLEENYEAFLMLVSPLQTQNAINFTSANINTIYTQNNE